MASRGWTSSSGACCFGGGDFEETAEMKKERAQYHKMVGVSFQENAGGNDMWAKNKLSMMKVPLEPTHTESLTLNPEAEASTLGPNVNLSPTQNLIHDEP